MLFRSRDATFALTLGGIAFLLSVIWGEPFIAVLRRFKIGKQIRIDGPQTHLAKMGTPTMGGLIIILATVIPTLLWARLDSRYVIVAVVATLPVIL